MFKIGQKYRIVTIVPTAEGWSDQSSVDTVVDVEGTLIKVASVEGERIINTASWAFVSAEPV